LTVPDCRSPAAAIEKHGHAERVTADFLLSEEAIPWFSYPIRLREKAVKMLGL
jgi:hypothetical protein